SALGTGALTFASGTTLQAAANGLSLANAMTLNGTDTVDTQSNALTLSGTISSTGGLTKIGAGTLTLSGSNLYGGGTALNAGTLAVGSNSALGTGDLTFANGTTLQAAANGLSLANAMTLNGTSTVDTQANALTLSGNIGGAGGLTKIGSGTLTLWGPSTYTGATNVNAGTLQAGVANAFSPLSAFTVASGATLDLNGFEQNIGSVAGAGAVTLGAARLFIGSDNTSTTFSGTISGGGLFKIGPGTLTPSGASTYCGPTMIAGALINFNAASNFGTGPILLNGGGLQWAAGTSTDISSRLAAFGALGATFDTNGNTVTLASALSGIGGVTKTGAGALVLSGIDTYRGPTTVAAGTLTVNGSIANSAVTVNSGAMLSGIGPVGGLTINSGGIFAPGNSPGTMPVQGNLASQSGALSLVQVNSTPASNTVVSGSATLAGTVQAAFTAGSYATRMYTILSAAGGLGGTTFNTLTTSNLPAGFTASLSYTATDATLNLTATLGQPVGPSSGPRPQRDARSVRRRQKQPARRLRHRLCPGARRAARRHRARLCKDIESAADAAKLRAALERVGRGLRRRQSHQRRSRGGRQPRSLRHDGRRRGRARLPPRARHGGGLRARGRRHQLGPGAGARHRHRAMRSRPGSTARRARVPPISPPRSLIPITGCRPTASPLPATISARASTRKASAAAWKAAIASRRSTAGSRPTRRSRRRASTHLLIVRPTSPAAASRSALIRATRPIPGASWAGALTGCCCSTSR